MPKVGSFACLGADSELLSEVFPLSLLMMEDMAKS